MTVNAARRAAGLEPIDVRCTKLFEAAAVLRRPFTPEAMRWKLDDGLALPYIDRGLVIDRLNLVVPDLWSDAYEPVGRDHVLCWLTVDGMTRQDVGEGGSPKERCTDALKRAAVKFGVAAYLLRLPAVRVKTETTVISPRMLKRLRVDYAAWLEGPGCVFGDPIDHGPSSYEPRETTATASPRSTQGQRRDELHLALLGDGNGGAPLTMRQVRGLITAAGVGGLPVTLTPDAASLAIGTLTDSQAEKLTGLLARVTNGEVEVA